MSESFPVSCSTPLRERARVVYGCRRVWRWQKSHGTVLKFHPFRQLRGESLPAFAVDFVLLTMTHIFRNNTASATAMLTLYIYIGDNIWNKTGENG